MKDTFTIPVSLRLDLLCSYANAAIYSIDTNPVYGIEMTESLVDQFEKAVRVDRNIIVGGEDMDKIIRGLDSILDDLVDYREQAEKYMTPREEVVGMFTSIIGKIQELTKIAKAAEDDGR